MQFCFEARDETDQRCCAATPASRRDARFSAQNTGSGTPPGCDLLPCLNRGYRFARPPATFCHPSRMSLADFSASHLFHRQQRRTELFGSRPFPTESLVPSLPWLPSVKCISAVGFKTGPFCTISAPIFDFDRCSFASRHGTRRIDGAALHRGMEHFHDARTRRTQRNNRTRERTPNHANQPERKQRGWHGKTLPFLYRFFTV